jgi:hypothetical protein
LRKDRAPLKARFLQIVLAGWQCRRMGSRIVWRPILHAISSEQQNGQIRCDLDSSPRHWQYERALRDGKSCPPFRMVLIPQTADFPDAHTSELIARLEPVAHLPDTSRETLVTEIQRQAESVPTIGKDCMCIYIPFPSRTVVEADYIAAELEPRISVRGELVSASFSPWIIGPTLLHAPSIIVGMQAAQMGQFVVRLRGPSPPNGPGPRLTAAFSSQKRPKKPR